LPKIDPFKKQYYVRKQELVYLAYDDNDIVDCGKGVRTQQF